VGQNGLKNKTMRNLIILICWIITIKALIKSNNTISEFNCSIENLEDTSQTLLIDSLQLEIMYIGSQLDSMHLKYDE
tara:strand:- start:327 stop:557 length:231 start_codon:yes stop_codon:yes gene_type:complete